MVQARLRLRKEEIGSLYLNVGPAVHYLDCISRKPHNALYSIACVIAEEFSQADSTECADLEHRVYSPEPERSSPVEWWSGEHHITSFQMSVPASYPNQGIP